MKIEIEKRIYDGSKIIKHGLFKSLELAHADHDHYDIQQTHADISNTHGKVSYLHLIEYRDDEHYDDYFFTKDEIPTFTGADYCRQCGANLEFSDSDCNC